MSLHGKVALVTGASRGIGKAIAERLGRERASIDKFIAGEIAQTPLRRIGQPDDIADVVRFLSRMTRAGSPF